jgi:hypothetical protein
MQWTMREGAGKAAGGVPLYRDAQEDPPRFFSPIAWQSPSALAAWRASQDYHSFIERIEPLCANMGTRTLMQVTHLSP